jgi:hypothetical protein
MHHIGRSQIETHFAKAELMGWVMDNQVSHDDARIDSRGSVAGAWIVGMSIWGLGLSLLQFLS